MTERLSTLLRDEADHLAVPPPPSAEILDRGRGLRRRRQTRTGLATGAAVVLLAVGGALLPRVLDDDGARNLQPAVDPGLGAVFSVGTTVYLDAGREQVSIDDKAIKSMYYTSAGVLVRHGNNPWSDGGGPQRFSLVTPAGEVEPVSVETAETVHATDPDQPYLAYAETVDGTVEVVVHDLRTDTEAARVPVPGDFRWGGWEAPPVAISGDLVHVGSADVARVVDWRTGAVSTTDTIRPGYPDVSGGRSLEETWDPEDETTTLAVVDVATGARLLEVESGPMSFADLSVDGRHLRVSSFADPTSPTVIYTVDTGAKVELEQGATDLSGWTADGDAMGVGKDGVTVCSAATGACETTPLEVEPGTGRIPADLKLGGATYES